jgi:ABC-2 type transport system permease protein
MRNFWLIAKHEYKRMVFRRAFILTSIAIPLGLALLFGLVIVVETSQENKLPLGYVDLSATVDASLLDELPEDRDRIEIRPFANETDAHVALVNQEIQAYFVLPETYPASLETQLFYWEEPPAGDVWRDFDSFIRVNLLHDYPESLQTRLYNGSDMTVTDITNGRVFDSSLVITFILPFVATLIFFMSTMMASGYTLQIVADEKENRTMEMMITAVTPLQLIGGKLIGILSAALTQLGIYLITIVAGFLILGPRIEALRLPGVPWGYLGLMLIFFLPSYFLIAAMMVTVSSAVTEIQQAQQVAGLLNLLFIAPLFLVALLFINPAHPVLQFMSLFPTTSFLTISLRWGLGSIATWQIVTSWFILITTTLGMIWVAAKVFRVGMLQYGQPLRVKSILAALRS